jgi:hypothetical protein
LQALQQQQQDSRSVTHNMTTLSFGKGCLLQCVLLSAQEHTGTQQLWLAAAAGPAT